MSFLLDKRLWFLAVRLALLLLVLSLFTFAPVRHASAQPNLIFNGDFSLGNVGFTTTYQFTPGNITPPKTYDIVTDPNNSHGSATSYGDNTSGTGLMMAVNGSTTSNDIVWSQTINVTTNQTHTFSMFISSWYPAAPAQLRVDINGTPIGFPQAPSTTGVWQQFSATFNPGGSSTATIDIVELSTAFGGNDYALDDLQVTGPTNENPSAIELISFSAQTSADYVTLAWQTGTEIDNAGFNLHRATATGGLYTKLNDTLIPAEGDPISGASYTFTDTDVVKGMTYYYQLEDLDIHGVSTFHGPVSAGPILTATPDSHLLYLPLITK